MSKKIPGKNFQQRKVSKPEMSPLPNRANKDPLLFLAIVFVVPFLLYMHTVKFELTDFDDYVILSLNTSLLANFGNAPDLFLTDAFLNKTSSFYRPLQSLTYMIDNHLSGGETFGAFHLTNVVLFGVIACLLFLFLRKMKVTGKLALFSTLLYCVHPLFISSVGWLPSRGDLLLTLFSLLAILFLHEHIEKGKVRYLILHWLTFTLALFCKETAAFLPFIFILYYFTFFYKNKLERKYLLNILLYGISGLFWFWLRSKSIGDSMVRNDLFEFGISAFTQNLRIIPESLASFILPFNIHVIPSFSNIKLVIGLGIMACIAFLIIKNTGRTRREKIFCIVWFLLLLLPTLVFRQMSVDYLNHRFLLPFIGILLFILFALPLNWVQHQINKISVAMISVTIVFGIITMIKSAAYADPMTFYDTAVEENPNSALAHNNRGWERINMADYAGASADFEASIKISGKSADPYLNNGIAKLYLKNYSEAEFYLNKSLVINPKSPLAYFYKGMIKANLGEIKESLDNFTKAIELDPNYVEAYEKKLIARYCLADYPGVIEDCNTLLEISPVNKSALSYKAASQQELDKKGQ